MISLDLFDNTALTNLDRDVIKYVNGNVECIIRVLLDLLEDNNDFTPEDFLPYNNFKIDNNTWSEMVYDLYDIVRSNVIREYIKPKYEYLLYVILQWWEDCSDSSDDLLPNKLDSSLAAKIKTSYTSEDGGNYIFNAITDFEEYYYILFTDHDFLPESLERLITIYLRDPTFFNELFGDVDLNEYHELMPKDLQEQFDELNYEYNKPANQNVSETTLLKDILECCERLQASHKYKESSEDDMNDFIRDLLASKHYDLRDQTRQGTSAGEKQAGELDILIRKDNFPYSIIEALKLSSVDESYISKHIDKIYKYDTLGYECNFIIAYVKIKNFSQFWENYLAFVKAYDYRVYENPLELIQFVPAIGKQYSELKCAVAELKRNDLRTRLYYIAIHIPD